MSSQNWLSLLPDALLLLSLPVMFLVNRFREAKTAKTFYTLAKLFLVLSLLAVLVFYDYSGYPEWLINNRYTTLFKVIIYLLAFAWFFLSLKWFLNKERSSLGFYSLSMIYLTMLSLLLSAQHLGIVGAAGLMVMGCNYFMIRLSRDETPETQAVQRRYLIFSMIFALALLAGITLLYQGAGSLHYTELYEFLSRPGSVTPLHLAAIVLVLCGFLYLIALAPFHFWFVDVIGTSILPVGGFLTIIPAFALFGCLADLILNVFFPVYGVIKPLLLGCAVLSIILGALSANGENNIRRLFAFATLYNLGLVYLCVVKMNDNSLLSAFVYLLVYILSISGIYTAFFGFKSRGEYLLKLDDVSGIAEVKPYIAAAFLVFMISLIGSPPLLGFLGLLSVLNNLVIQGSYLLIVVTLISLLLIANAYLRVIQAVYFNERHEDFDRADYGIYVCLFINLMIVLISLLNPRYLMNDVEKILFAIF